MKNRLIIAAIAVVAMFGCQKESDQVVSDITSTVSFSSSGIATTRTTEQRNDEGVYVDYWEGNDRIGVSSEGYISNGFYIEFANIEYAAICQESSIITDFEVLSLDNAFVKPNSMSSDITYYAYYPYTSSVDDDGNIEVDISKQNVENNGNLGDADFMVAATTITTPKDKVAFEFAHKLSKVVFKVEFDDEVTIRDENAVIGDLTAYVESLPVAMYDRNGEVVAVNASLPSDYYKMSSKVDGDKAIFTAILHPIKDMAYELEFCIGDQKYLADISGLEFESGTIHTYNVVLGRGDVEITPSNIENWVVVEATDFSGYRNDGDGTRNNPYQICTAEELLQIGTGDWSGDSNYILVNDITLSEFYDSPIFKDLYFDGTFDGDGHTITNPKTENGTSDEQSTFSIFKTIGDNGRVFDLNVKIEEVDFSNAISQPIITAIATNNYGIVDNCSCEGSAIISEYNAGYGIFLIGENSGTVAEDCRNNAKLIYDGNTTDNLPIMSPGIHK